MAKPINKTAQSTEKEQISLPKAEFNQAKTQLWQALCLVEMIANASYDTDIDKVITGADGVATLFRNALYEIEEMC